ncbi:DMT family transporter [Mesobacterium pallidum]|uniref:DMT family transporter n=1 Tax=Mesobacterium pallidum TaxID=2872037 RepID=UPI001EE284EE|nr:DMT family transporter [Mesobacterium pallidum]
MTAVFALLAAACFGFNVHVHQAALDEADPWSGALVSVGATAMLFWLAAPFALDPAWLLTPAALIFLGVGLLYPATAQTLQILSVTRVGPAISSALGSFTPLFAVLFAVTLQGEEMTWQAGLGLALMIGGLVLVALPRGGIRRSWPLIALALPLGASLARGINQPVTKAGLAIVASPWLATTLAATMSTLSLALVVALRHRAGRTARRGRRGLGLFALSGGINGLGLLSLNTALGQGAVVSIAPLTSTAPLWSLAFGALLFRREALGLRHLVLALLVVAGGTLILTR